MGKIVFIFTVESKQKKMKVFALLAITLLFVGYVRSEDEPDVSDLANDDDWCSHHHFTHVSHVVSHSVSMKVRYQRCTRQVVVIKRNCKVRLARLHRLYHHYKKQSYKAKRMVSYWTKKYTWCNKFCWWRKLKGDQQDQTYAEEQ